MTVAVVVATAVEVVGVVTVLSERLDDAVKGETPLPATTQRTSDRAEAAVAAARAVPWPSTMPTLSMPMPTSSLLRLLLSKLRQENLQKHCCRLWRRGFVGLPKPQPRGAHGRSPDRRHHHCSVRCKLSRPEPLYPLPAVRDQTRDRLAASHGLPRRTAPMR